MPELPVQARVSPAKRRLPARVRVRVVRNPGLHAVVQVRHRSRAAVRNLRRRLMRPAKAARSTPSVSLDTATVCVAAQVGVALRRSTARRAWPRRRCEVYVATLRSVMVNAGRLNALASSFVRSSMVNATTRGVGQTSSPTNAKRGDRSGAPAKPGSRLRHAQPNA